MCRAAREQTDAEITPELIQLTSVLLFSLSELVKSGGAANGGHD